jgi:hypothetical protein
MILPNKKNDNHEHMKLPKQRASVMQEHDIIKYFDKNFCAKVLWTTFCGILSGYFLSLFWVFTEQCHVMREHLRTSFMMSFLR